MLEARGQPKTGGGQSGRGGVHVREGSASGRWRGRGRVPGLAREVVVLGYGGDGPRPQSEHQASGAASVGRRDRATCAAGVWTAGAGAAHHALRWPGRMEEEEEEEREQQRQQQQRAGATGAVLGGGGQDASLERARAGGGSGASRGAPTDRQQEARGRRGFGSQQQRQRQQQSASPAWAWESWRLSARRLRHVAGA